MSQEEFEQACKNGNFDLVKQMASNNNYNWHWSIESAAEGGHMNIIQFLVKKGADINYLSKENVKRYNKYKQYIKNKKWNILYTPPYSPWFNPIENIFGIIKHNFRKNKMIKESFESITCTTIVKTITSTINKILSDKYLL